MGFKPGVELLILIMHTQDGCPVSPVFVRRVLGLICFFWFNTSSNSGGRKARCEATSPSQIAYFILKNDLRVICIEKPEGMFSILIL